MLQSLDNPSDKRRLVLFNQQVQELIQILNLSLDPNTANEKEMLLAILQANKCIKAAFDSETNKAESIEDL